MMDKTKKTNREVTSMKNLKKGFTLIELMIVVAIIAILAAAVAPLMANQLKKAKDAKAIAVLGACRSASSIYYADNDGTYADDLGDIYALVDSGAKRIFTAVPTTAVGSLTVGQNNIDGGSTTATTVAATLVTASTSVGGVSFAEGDIYLGDANDTDTKGNVWATQY
jgi:prepilin-type N-terminal cleavage/methylation domain-containing protein